jgi:Uma2 family endonuclease
MTAARTGNRPFRFSREQYYRLGELGFFDGKRVERIHGEIVELSPIGWPHIVACRKTAELLEELFAGVAWVSRNEQPIALADSDPQPDVLVVPGRFENYSNHPTTAWLVVEVSDTTLTRDTTIKVEMYAAAGIADYWVLDLNHRELLVFRDPATRPDGAAEYRTRLAFDSSQSVSPLAAPAASVRVADLLP